MSRKPLQEIWHPGFQSHGSHGQIAQELLDQELYFKVVSTRRRHQVARCLWPVSAELKSIFRFPLFLVSDDH